MSEGRFAAIVGAAREFDEGTKEIVHKRPEPIDQGLQLADDSANEDEELSADEESAPKTKKRKNRPRSSAADDISVTDIANMLTTPTVSITNRYVPRTVIQLRKASIARKALRKSPHTMQDILEEAASDWLKKHAP